jgi:hypothetical protein
MLKEVRNLEKKLFLKPRNVYPFIITKETVEKLNKLKKEKILFFDFNFKNHESDFFIFPVIDKNVFFFLKLLFISFIYNFFQFILLFVYKVYVFCIYLF